MGSSIGHGIDEVEEIERRIASLAEVVFDEGEE